MELQSPQEGVRRPTWLPEDSRLQECMHERHYDARERIISALGGVNLGPRARQARRLAGCCSSVKFFVDPRVGKVRPWVCRCRDRMCPFCSRARASHVTGQLRDAMEKMKRPRMLVLTVRSMHGDLGSQLRSLRKWFRRLRSAAFWQKHVRGGVYTVEITRNEDTGLWHPHLHVVYDGEYMPQKGLRFVWHRITQGSEVVWIKDVSDRQGAAVELAKYISKPARVAKWGTSAIREYSAGVSATRMVQSFGSCYSQGVADVDPGEPDSPESYAVSLQRVVWLARCGVKSAQRLALLLADRWPVFAGYVFHELPQLRPERTQAEKVGAVMRMLSGRGPPAGGKDPAAKDEVADVKIFLAFAAVREGETDGEYALLEVVGGAAD